ncbi:MAG: hypothetical protein HC845_03275 [Akkermansiaceae bacterium]|nr:hypothetical protein [Akkermansiaceae bacterium]
MIMPQVSPNLLCARIGELLTTSVNQPAAPANQTYFKDIIDQIAAHASDPIAGQLLVYQVFLRVPLKLLKAEGIRSLRFVDQKTVIKSKELYDSISNAAHESICIALPPFKNQDDFPEAA